MPHGENGLTWTSGTWSENHVMEEEEKLYWNRWLNGVLVSNSNKDFNQDLFEDEVLVYKRRLPKREYLSSILLYLEGERFDLEPIHLNELIRNACSLTNKNHYGIWFYGEQSTNYLYDVSGFGTYTLNSLKTEAEFVNYDACLEPLFKNLLDRRSQSVENNYRLFSGVVGVNKDWLIVMTLKIEEEITITIHGEKAFCELIRKGIEESR